MSITPLLETFTARGVAFAIVGDRLRFKDPRQELTDSDRAAIKAHKSELLDLLRSTAGDVDKVDSEKSEVSSTQAWQTEAPKSALEKFLAFVETRRMPNVPNLIRINRELRELWTLAENECSFFLDLAGRQTKRKPPIEYSKVAPSLAAVGVSTSENDAHDQSDTTAAMNHARAARRAIEEMEPRLRRSMTPRELIEYSQVVAHLDAGQREREKNNHSDDCKTEGCDHE